MRSNKPVAEVYQPQYHNAADQVTLQQKGMKKYPELTKFFGGFKNPIGIEIEVEGVNFPDKTFTYWGYEEDGSLKIKGVEFISHPISGHNIDYALAEISDYLNNWACLWTHRTSVHVHTFVGDLSVNKLRSLVALYAVLENLFFSLVDEKRRGNPYCYHIRDVDPQKIVFSNSDMKYCALNLGTGIYNYNTIEFRHMHGTGDVKSLRRWIQLIVKLHRFVQENNNKDINKRIRALNTTSQYMELLRDVFGTTAMLFHKLDLKKELEDGVFWAKLFLLEDE